MLPSNDELAARLHDLYLVFANQVAGYEALVAHVGTIAVSMYTRTLCS